MKTQQSSKQNWDNYFIELVILFNGFNQRFKFTYFKFFAGKHTLTGFVLITMVAGNEPFHSFQFCLSSY